MNSSRPPSGSHPAAETPGSSGGDPASERQLHSLDDLIAVLAGPERPEADWRIGAESEKFGVHERSGTPLAYDGPFGVLRIFEWLMEHRAWEPVTEVPGGP